MPYRIRLTFSFFATFFGLSSSPYFSSTPFNLRFPVYLCTVYVVSFTSLSCAVMLKCLTQDMFFPSPPNVFWNHQHIHNIHPSQSILIIYVIMVRLYHIYLSISSIPVYRGTVPAVSTVCGGLARRCLAHALVTQFWYSIPFQSYEIIL